MTLLPLSHRPVNQKKIPPGLKQTERKVRGHALAPKEGGWKSKQVLVEKKILSKGLIRRDRGWSCQKLSGGGKGGPIVLNSRT